MLISDGDNTYRRCRAGTCCDADGVYQVFNCLDCGFKNGYYKVSGGCTITVTCRWFNRPRVTKTNCWNPVFDQYDCWYGGCIKKANENWRKPQSLIDQIPPDFDPSGNQFLPPFVDVPPEPVPPGDYGIWNFGEGTY
ncbi:MAG: hypothetical protein ACREHD_30070 [Pirellulales bacterium]